MLTINTLAKLKMQLGECPRWNEQEESWYWGDILGKALYRYETLTNKLSSRTFDFNPACFAFTKKNQESLKKEPLAGSVLLLDLSKKGALPFKLNTYKPQ